MIENYSSRIQDVIQRELFNAKKSIKIVVAWFTNDLLFGIVKLKVQTNVSVEIILNKDEINLSEDNQIDFDEFVSLGGILRWNDTKQLLHSKYCIIDDNVVISGSYNWTKKAEYNTETITLFRDEKSTSDFYLNEFSKLAAKYRAEAKAEKKKEVVRKVFNPNELKPFTPNWTPLKLTDNYLLNVIFFEELKDIEPIVLEEFPELHFYESVTKSIIPNYLQAWETKNKGKNLETRIFKLLDCKTLKPLFGTALSDLFVVNNEEVWFKFGLYWIQYNMEEMMATTPPLFIYRTKPFDNSLDFNLVKERNKDKFALMDGLCKCFYSDYKYSDQWTHYQDFWVLKSLDTYDVIDIKNKQLYSISERKDLDDFILSKWGKDFSFVTLR